MPKKQLPDVMSFAAFTRSLVRRGFRQLSPVEFQSDYRRLALQAPSPREGRETGFVFSSNRLEVVVWTTFLTEAGRARDEDAGWVLIKDGDEARYFSHPFHRTKNFLYSLLWAACIAQWRVAHRPLCPVCGARMDIANGQGLKARYWKCYRPESHKKPEFLSWDYGLPEAALEHLKALRQRRQKYRATLREQGKIPGVAMQRRLRWKVGRPKNVIPAR